MSNVTSNQWLAEAVALLAEWGEPYTEADKGRPSYGERICDFLQRFNASNAHETAGKPLTFAQGYVCAVAEIIRTHGEEVIARDVLRGLGKGINWPDIAAEDLEALSKAGLYSSEKTKADVGAHLECQCLSDVCRCPPTLRATLKAEGSPK